MGIEEVRKVLDCWLNCPYSFGENNCNLSVEEYAECGCWSEARVRDAVRELLKLQENQSCDIATHNKEKENE